MSATRLDVALGERSYPVLVSAGGVEGLGAAMAEVLPVGPAAVVTNPVVGALYLEPALDSLRAAGFAPFAVQVPDGEAHKTLDTWQVLVEDLLAAGMDRRTPVVALGGGVTGDIAGFAAATVLRGVPLVQVPTSLLAMVDSSVGGKTGVNSRRGKNLVGAFHQPRLVFAPLATLRTLDPAELRSGLGEVLKHGLLADPDLFALCRDRAAEVRAGAPELLARCVLRSCAVKAAVVARDEREAGLRAVLNLGHTVGHAIETAAGHGVLRHGECVAMGLVAETAWAAARGSCPPELPEQVAEAVAGLGLATRPPPLSRASLLRAAGVDKKVARGTLATAVVRRIGHVELERIPLDELPALFASLVGSPEA